jgi:hypothetical protein
MEKPMLNNSPGLYLSGANRIYYWIAYTAWLAAVFAGLYAEYQLRTDGQLGFYLFEAFAAMLGWLIAFVIADHTVISTYRRTFDRLLRRNAAMLLLDLEKTGRIRRELAANPLLRWFRPPRAAHVGTQLLSASLWWTAVIEPEDASPWRRYGEWIIDVLFGYLPLSMALVLTASFLPGGFVWLALLLLSLGLATIGYSLLRLAARRQAVLDYFRAWLS